MPKPKKFKIIKEYHTYSKKKGAFIRRNIVAQDLASYEDAVKQIKAWHPEAKIDGNIATNVGGLLYPTRYEIK